MVKYTAWERICGRSSASPTPHDLLGSFPLQRSPRVLAQVPLIFLWPLPWSLGSGENGHPHCFMILIYGVPGPLAKIWMQWGGPNKHTHNSESVYYVLQRQSNLGLLATVPKSPGWVQLLPPALLHLFMATSTSVIRSSPRSPSCCLHNPLGPSKIPLRWAEQDLCPPCLHRGNDFSARGKDSL